MKTRHEPPAAAHFQPLRIRHLHTEPKRSAYVARIVVLPIPDRLSLDDWRAHVPMPLLEGWSTLSDDQRLTVYVMAQSATHPYECANGPDEPAMNWSRDFYRLPTALRWM